MHCRAVYYFDAICKRHHFIIIITIIIIGRNI